MIKPEPTPDQMLPFLLFMTALTGINAGAFIIRVYLNTWDAVNVTALVAGLLTWGWAYRRYQHVVHRAQRDAALTEIAWLSQEMGDYD